MSPPLGERTIALRALAYAKLGVTERDTHAGPQITPELATIAKTIRRAGQPQVTHRVLDSRGHGTTLEEDTRYVVPYGPGADLLTSWPSYLQACDDPDARKVLTVYYELPPYQRAALPIEAFCLAATVSPIRVLELLVGACVRMGTRASTIIAATNHPRVVQKTIDMALTDEGGADRAVLHRATGFLPSPGGAKTNITIQQNASATANAQAAAVSPPPAEQTVRRLVERFHEARGLPPPDVSTALAALPEGHDDDALPAGGGRRDEGQLTSGGVGMGMGGGVARERASRELLDLDDDGAGDDDGPD